MASIEKVLGTKTSGWDIWKRKKRLDAGVSTLLYGNREITVPIWKQFPLITLKWDFLRRSVTGLEACRPTVDTDYWFYLTTPDTGEVIYAKTNEEHNANREKYL
jgi:hypothetical protein